MGFLSGVGGLIGGLSGLFGGNNVPTGPAPWLMPNMNQAAGNAFSGISGLSGYGNAAQGTSGPAANTFQNLYNNPYAGGYLGGANVASAMGQTAASNAYGTGAALTGAGIGTLPYVQSIFNTAMDPQGALYSRTFQNVQDQSRANLEASGVASTPYGAGIQNQAGSNFNIDWQNQQLGRQALGAQAGGNLLTAGGNLANLGTGIQNLAPSQYLSASGMPFGTFGQIGNAQNAALSSYLGNIGGAQNISNLPIQDWLSYVQAGNQAGGVANQAYNNQLQANQQQFNQSMMFGNMLGGSLYGLGQGGFGMNNMFGFGGGPGGFSGWGGGGGGWGGYSPALASMGAGINPQTGFISSFG
jgi:hypothetical protein